MFKYYHATSSIFYHSIRQHGLGIDPIMGSKVLDTLKYLQKMAEENLQNDVEYLKVRDSTKAMVNQTFLKVKNKNGRWKKYNYRHTNIHVSLSIDRAVRHASLNKYGSEILGRCLDLYQLLINFGINMPDNHNNFEIVKYISVNPKLIIVEITEIDENRLIKDDGKTAIEALDYLRTQIPQMSINFKKKFFMHCNFEVLYSIDPQFLVFYELEFDGHPDDSNFEYSLSRII